HNREIGALLERLPQSVLAQTLADGLHHGEGALERLSRIVRAPGILKTTPQGEFRFPQLHRVAKRRREIAGGPQVPLRTVPVALGPRNLTSETPALHQVLARSATRGQVETRRLVRSRGAEVALGNRELTQAREHANRVAKPHPLAGRQVLPESEYLVVLILRTLQVAAHSEDIGEIELGVRLRSGIAAPASDARADRVERLGLVEVAEVGVQPAETVEQPMMDRLVAYPLGERQSFVERGQGVVIVPLTRQRQPAHEATEEQRDEHAGLAGKGESLGLHPRRLVVVAGPVAQQTADRQRQ